MSIYAKVTAYIGVVPGTTEVYHEPNRENAPGAYENVVITPHAQWSDLLLTGANLQLCVNKETRQLETRPAGQIDGWGGQWAISDGGRTATCDQWTLALERPDLPPINPALPIITTATLPEVRGNDFFRDGKRVCLSGCDMFMAFRQFLDGGAPALAPFFQESHELGFNMWRVFLMGSKAQNQVMDLRPTEPGYYDQLRPFALALNQQGIILLATVFVDAQDVMPQQSARQAHWRAVADRLRGTATLLSGGNEWRKNGFDPGELSDPGMLWSRGSDLSIGDNDHAPYRPYGSFAEYHPRRDMSASLMDTVASPVYIYNTNKLGAPLIIDEPPKFGTNGGDYDSPALTRRFFQHYGAECGGAVFHNWFGQRGLLMDLNTRNCAAAAVKGMTI